MAAHCCGDDIFAAPLEHDSDRGTGPSPSAAVPEEVPLPKAQPAKGPALPGLGEPPPSKPLPKKEAEQGPSPVPVPNKPPVPIGKMDFMEPNDSPIWK